MSYWPMYCQSARGLVVTRTINLLSFLSRSTRLQLIQRPGAPGIDGAWGWKVWWTVSIIKEMRCWLIFLKDDLYSAVYSPDWHTWNYQIHAAEPSPSWWLGMYPWQCHQSAGRLKHDWWKSPWFHLQWWLERFPIQSLIALWKQRHCPKLSGHLLCLPTNIEILDSWDNLRKFDLQLTLLITASAVTISRSGSSFTAEAVAATWGSSSDSESVSSSFIGTGLPLLFGREGTSTQNVCFFLGCVLGWSIPPFLLPCDFCSRSTMITSSLSSCEWAGLDSWRGCIVGSLLMEVGGGAISQVSLC